MYRIRIHYYMNSITAYINVVYKYVKSDSLTRRNIANNGEP